MMTPLKNSSLYEKMYCRKRLLSGIQTSVFPLLSCTCRVSTHFPLRPPRESKYLRHGIVCLLAFCDRCKRPRVKRELFINIFYISQGGPEPLSTAARHQWALEMLMGNRMMSASSRFCIHTGMHAYTRTHTSTAHTTTRKQSRECSNLPGRHRRCARPRPCACIP